MRITPRFTVHYKHKNKHKHLNAYNNPGVTKYVMAYTSGHKFKKYYRSVFLSDFHMGSKLFDAPAALSFLRSIDCKYLFLVGDIIDGWKMNKRWYWTEDCSRIIDELVKLRRNGTKIIYLPGNHDDEIRKFNPLARREFAHRIGIRIRDKVIHDTNDGRRFLVMHGDQFDNAILRGPVSQWSDRFYHWVLDRIEGKKPKVRINGKIKPFSLAKSLNRHGQWALKLMNNFEYNVVKQAKRSDVDGLICGHTHIPVIKTIKDVIYANAGCWLRTGHTALVETEDGDLNLIDWPCSAAAAPSLFDSSILGQPSYVTLTRPVSRERIMTNKIISIIQSVWPEQSIKQQAPHEWVDIIDRDTVTLSRRAILPAHNILDEKRPINLATKIFLRNKPAHS